MIDFISVLSVPPKLIRSLDGLKGAIAHHGSISAVCREYSITPKTLKRLQEFFSSLPDDTKKTRFYRGRTLGRWTLVERIGAGGHAEVWKVQDGAGEAAMKILRQPSGMPLARFLAEVDILQRLGKQPGILPLLDCALTKDGTAEDTWLVLPVAVQLRQAVDCADPISIVKGVCELANTLVALHALGISHRDIKPENLYIWQGAWTISDFGIASFPGKTAMTSTNKKLGPVHFIAPEMLHTPKQADGAKADVYSLAKTLWVLLAGQRYPPPGEQRIDVEQVRIEKWLNITNPDPINIALEGATTYDAIKRSSMSLFAKQLASWVRSESGTG